MITKECIEEYKRKAHDLVSRMTLEEKISQMVHDAAAVEHLEIKSYNWWNEALHGVARAGVATVFPQAIGMAATFDAQLLQKMGDAVSTEGRAKYNMFQKQGDHGTYTNEKYKGDALLQKEFTVDFLQKKTKKNEGEVPQYYVEGNHEAIIDPATFDYVQAEMARRMKDKHRYSGVSMFSSKIKCGECGCWYGSKVWHSTDKYRRVIYQCNHKYKGCKPCSTPHVSEEQVKDVFVRAVNILLSEKEELSANVQMVIAMLCDSVELEKRQAELKEELEVVVGLVERCVAENARVALDQDEYTQRYNGLVSRYEAVKAQYDEVTQAVANKAERKKLLEQFLHTVEIQEPVTQFGERLWSSLVDFVAVYGEKDIRVTFKDGTEIQA